MRSRNFINCLLLLSIVYVIPSFSYTWDWMNCHSGEYIGEGKKHRGEQDHCLCPSTTSGTECQLCNNEPGSCGDDQFCDQNSFWVGPNGKNAFDCSPQGGQIFGQPIPRITSEWDLTNGNEYPGLITIYHGADGAPLIFNCSFSQCTTGWKDATTAFMDCKAMNCTCTEWCIGGPLANIVPQLTGEGSLTCDMNQRTCQFFQSDMDETFVLNCQPGTCRALNATIPPSVPQSNNALIIGLSVGIPAFLIVFLAACLVGRRFVRNRKEKKWRELKTKSNEVQLSWQDISCSLGDGTRILHKVSGLALPGTLTAILGPSGAGKTSFIDILAERKNTGQIEGTVSVNGYARESNFKRISGYVYQEEKFLGTMTVREHLKFIADLRLPSYMPDAEKFETISEVMDQLGISHIANSVIGSEMSRGISGGERRRLSIASELLTDPMLLFLDEPTSGLDSFNAFSLIRTLKELAKTRKRTIIMSIHQPSSNIFKMFDSLVLLAWGETLYFGPTKESLDYFEKLNFPCPVHYNPADFLIDLVTMNDRTQVRTLASHYRKDQYPKVMEKLRSEGSLRATSELDDSPFSHVGEYATNPIDQIICLSVRTIRHNLRNPFLFRTQYLLTTLLAISLGFIYWKSCTLNLEGIQNRVGALFFEISLLTFSAMSSIDTFFQERGLFLRERANGMYRTSSYFIAKTLCDIIPMRVLPSLIFSCITFWMIGYQTDLYRFGIYVAVLVLVSVSAGAMCIAVSSFVPSLSVGNLLSIVIMLINMLFGGFLVNRTSLPWFVGWLKWLSFLNYAYEILLCNELNGLVFRVDASGLPDGVTYVTYDGTGTLKSFGFDSANIPTDFIWLGSFCLFYLLISYGMLRFAIKEKR